MKQKFSLRDVVVMSGNGEDEDTQLAMMGLHGAQLLDRLLEPGDTVGSSWGRAMSALIENLSWTGQSRQLICMPIIGDPSDKLGSRYRVNTLACSAATKLKGEPHPADFPALLDNPLVHSGVMQSQHPKTISVYWDNLDVTLVGTGSPAIRDSANWHAFHGGEESDDLNARQVADGICSRFFDIRGAMAEANMSKRTLSIEMSKLEQARYSIGIATSEEEYSEIVGVLRGEYINCLVADSGTVELLLK